MRTRARKICAAAASTVSLSRSSRLAAENMPRISFAELKRLVREKTSNFLHFAYNGKTGEFFGKTCKGWGLTFSYLFVFYSVLAALFAVHMAIFYAATPQPGRDVLPVNFGRYAYPNYPNARIGLISVPGSFSYSISGNQAKLSSSKQRDVADLISAANSSGAPDVCVDEMTNFGYDVGTPCIFFRVQKVLQWAPEEINEDLSSSSTLPLSCSADTISGLDVEMMQHPDGLPLDLPNHSSSSRNRSYPFRGQDSSYIIPVMAVVVNLTAISDPVPDRFSIEISCGVNLTAISLANPPTQLSRLYEIPRSASVTISVTH